MNKEQAAMLMFAGYNIQVTSLLTDTITHRESRTWKQRLFSLPWQPWRTHSFRTEVVPSRKIIVAESRKTLFMHPFMVQEVRLAVEALTLQRKRIADGL